MSLSAYRPPANVDDNTYLPPPPRHARRPTDSQSSVIPLVAVRPPSSERGQADQRMPRGSYYHDDGYDDPFDPRDIVDDGEDDLEEQPGRRGAYQAAAAGTGTAAAGVAATGFLSRFGKRDASGSYGPLAHAKEGGNSEWLRSQNSGNKRLRWIVGSVVALLVLAAIVGGIVGGVLSRTKSSNKTSTSSSSTSGGLWDINSAQIKAVLNNDNLHKVFPSMDYTPLNAQYPACLSNPPDQNNVTLDMALLSQLTPAIRLYGTDCNQTEMVLAGINQLGYNDSMTVWLGVYLGSNETTNVRQLAQMYDVLDNNNPSRFSGIIIGNEAIFEGGMTAAQLETELTEIRANLTAKGIRLTVSTSQLGVTWTETPALAAASDIVMSNVHPFFGGVPAAQGAAWAWTFWLGNDVPLTDDDGDATGTLNGTTTTFPKQIISEIGWPSQGGQDCGDANATDYGCTSSTEGAVASIDNLNTFMDSWVCDALGNTTYFWFEAFDEPWKHEFDTQYDHWEPYWGLFDQSRDLKDGVVIPDCGGKTADKPY